MKAQHEKDLAAVRNKLSNYFCEQEYEQSKSKSSISTDYYEEEQLTSDNLDLLAVQQNAGDHNMQEDEVVPRTDDEISYSLYDQQPDVFGRAAMA